MLTGLGLEWEPLILARLGSLTVSTTDELTALLLGHESHRSYAVAAVRQLPPIAPLFGLLGSSLVEIHYADERQKNSNGKSKNKVNGKGKGSERHLWISESYLGWRRSSFLRVGSQL
ncbi:hypothetical protein CRG98_013662 [Punica granatum]|uniref:Uncharacterized protein n=1 Tax=Punica granatum TaxID=22663 RepID=A0A2I0KBR0_PUNGR|nr:hypothetical protein CRG98_013662 [Punica granatum]